MDMNPMSDDSLYPAPGSPPAPLSRSPSVENEVSTRISQQVAWEEYQRDRQVAEAHGEGVLVKDVTEDDMGYDGDVEVIYPDAYEEPDVRVAEKVSLKRDTVENDVVWQSGIVDHMETLDCNSDANDSPRRKSWLKGRKRRSRTTSEIKHLQHMNSAGSSDYEVNEMFDDNGRYSSKRIRRRSRTLHQKIWASPEYQVSSREHSQLPANGQSATHVPDSAKNGTDDAMDLD